MATAASAFAAPRPLDPAQDEHHRNRAMFHCIVHLLHEALPPPSTDDPLQMARRNAAALSVVAALDPANAAEAQLAAQFAGASFQSFDCLRLGHLLTTEAEMKEKCFAQAALMQRQSAAALRALERLREAEARREKRAGSPPGWAGHIALQYMSEALREICPDATLDAVPMPPASPPMEAPAPEAAAPAAMPDPAPPPPTTAEVSAPASIAAPFGNAELAARVAMAAEVYLPDPVQAYATQYPERVRIIRRHGGMPVKPGFPPPEEWILDILVSSQAPMLLAIDGTLKR